MNCFSLFFSQQKRFIKGLRQYGKNFFRIRKELLPNKETVSHLFPVEYICHRSWTLKQTPFQCCFSFVLKLKLHLSGFVNVVREMIESHCLRMDLSAWILDLTVSMLGACTGALRCVFSQNRIMTVYIIFGYSSIQLHSWLLMA